MYLEAILIMQTKRPDKMEKKGVSNVSVQTLLEGTYDSNLKQGRLTLNTQHQFIFHWKNIFRVIFVICLPSKPPIVFSSQKPFYSQPTIRDKTSWENLQNMYIKLKCR